MLQRTVPALENLDSAMSAPINKLKGSRMRRKRLVFKATVCWAFSLKARQFSCVTAPMRVPVTEWPFAKQAGHPPAGQFRFTDQGMQNHIADLIISAYKFADTLAQRFSCLS